MRTLLHICCAPCSIACIQTLREEGMNLTGYWYNPNIHPYTEYRSRHNTLVEYAASIHLPLIEGGGYGLRSFLGQVGEDFDGRCAVCYRMRLEAAAEAAAQGGFDAFTTTLLISPYQNHELLRQVGEAAGARCGVPFLYRDFRPVFRQGQEQARQLGLYMQKYCGCIFSEEERYRRKKKKPQ